MFINSLGKEFISSDKISLTLYRMKDEILNKGIDEEKCENILNLIVHAFKNSRSKFNEDFMG